MKKELLRDLLFVVVAFPVLWYAGAMFNFFPFYADDLAIRAIGFTGFLLCIALAVCTGLIVDAIKNKKE